VEFKLPDLGEGVAEAEIERWLVREGDEVAEDDPLVEVITDKATVEIPSPWAGAVAHIHVPAGEVVPVGTVLVTIDGFDRAAQGGVAEIRRSAQESRARRVKATPPVRKLARELGIELAEVPASGDDGRVTRADVERYARSRAAEPSRAPERLDVRGAPEQREVSRGPRQQEVSGGPGQQEVSRGPGQQEVSGGPGRREALRGIRRAIADRMSESHRTIPPVTHVEECDATELDATRRLAYERYPAEPRLTYLPFILKAVVSGLRDYPALNATLDEDAQKIVFHDGHHIGIAVDTPEGLVVPVIRDAGHKSLRDLAGEIEDLAERARAGRLEAEEMRGGTFTITSPGAFGGLMATPLILPPQVGILGVHRATDRPVVRDGRIVIRKIMNLSITFDHRVLDGMTAARFALDVVKLLEHPAVLALDA
jgi:pyruvate/2-oxoglutarate dehydrogenase complex dihydrolipoamide acyltransferase (E2) component